jgi:hypothetical protein
MAVGVPAMGLGGEAGQVIALAPVVGGVYRKWITCTEKGSCVLKKVHAGPRRLAGLVPQHQITRVALEPPISRHPPAPRAPSMH